MTPAPNTQRAIAALAADAIAVGAGGRLPTSVDYQSSLGVGAGTVQQALRVLEAAGALEVHARGRRGRVVARADIGPLWSLAHFAPVRFMLPPPGALELYGLMDALEEHFGRLGVPLRILHRRGGRGRLARLDAGEADVALLSAGAAAGLVGGGGELAARGLEASDLGPDTYYAPDSIVVLAAADLFATQRPEAVRVGIDSDSFDHVRLTEAEFPRSRGYRYVECRFPSMPVAVLDGRVDAGIWHRALLLISPQLAGVAVAPLRERAARTARQELSHGVLVASNRRSEAVAVCRGIDGASIRARQRRLLGLDPEAPELAEVYWMR